MYFTKVKIYEKDKGKGKGGGSDPDAASYSALHCQNWQDQGHTESMLAGQHFDTSNSRSKKSWSRRSRWSSQRQWSLSTPTTQCGVEGGGTEGNGAAIQECEKKEKEHTGTRRREGTSDKAWQTRAGHGMRPTGSGSLTCNRRLKWKLFWIQI